MTLLFLASCSDSLIKQQGIKDENLYTYSVTVGSTLVLNQNIDIATNLGRTFFQNGKATREHNINIYYPHCSITVNTIADFNRTISPTTFTITKVIDGEEYAQGQLLFADNNIQIASDGPIISGLVSYYYLHSENAPDVRTLECIQWDSLYENNYLSISEIRKSLGDIFTLNVK